MGPSSSRGLFLRSLEPKADPFLTMEDYVDSDEDLESVLARFPQEDMGRASLTAPSVGYKLQSSAPLADCCDFRHPPPGPDQPSELGLLPAPAKIWCESHPFFYSLVYLPFVLQGMVVDISVAIHAIVRLM